ncbi:hypothetical protein OS493_038494, partial [Desmophyllum pertusum]
VVRKKPEVYSRCTPRNTARLAEALLKYDARLIYTRSSRSSKENNSPEVCNATAINRQ